MVLTMPFYEYECGARHVFTRYLTLKHFQNWAPCECGLIGVQRITAPAMVKVAPDLCYDSPIDGTPITSWAAREEDLKRNGCRPYDPAMKDDAARFRQDSQQAVERAMDETVEELVTKMPTAKRGKLYSELTEKNLIAEPRRITA